MGDYTFFFFLNLRTDKLACILFGQSKYDSANIHYNLLFQISILLTELDPSTSYIKCLAEKENLLYRIMYILYVSVPELVLKIYFIKFCISIFFILTHIHKTKS